MQIRLIDLLATDFMSFPNIGICISDLENSVTAILGQNKDDVMSMSNGSGKSSILEAITYLFFGTTSRDIQYTDDVISFGKPKCAVAGTFKINDNGFTIQREKYRGKTPTITLTQEGHDLIPNSDNKTKQEYIEKLIGYNKLSFFVTSMFHQDFIAFPDLKPAERAAILTDIGNLNCWVEAGVKAKAENSNIGTEIWALKKDIENLQSKINYLQAQDLEVKKDAFNENRTLRLIDLKREIKSLKNQLATQVALDEKKRSEIILRQSTSRKRAKELDSLIEKHDFDQDKFDNLGEQLVEVSSKARSKEFEFDKVTKALDKWNKTGVGECPTCKQQVTKEHIADHAKDMKKEQSKLSGELSKLLEQRDLITEASNKMKQAYTLFKLQSDEKYKLETSLKYDENALRELDNNKTAAVIQQSITSNEHKLNTIKSEVNPYDALIAENLKEQEVLQTEVDTAESNIRLKTEEMKYNEFWIEGYKKIRMLLFETMIDQLQQFTEEYLQNYSSTITVNISNQKENKSGVKKDEIFIEVLNDGHSVGYKSYSGGERQKIKMAISMALARLVEEQSDRSFNFVAFDEPNNALDDVGKEANARLLKSVAETTGKAVLVIDHDDFFRDQFDNQLMVVKDEGESKVFLCNE